MHTSKWAHLFGALFAEMRFLWLLLSLAPVAGCRLGGGSATHFPGAPLIVISVDTLRADHLPGYGYSAVQTPNLQALQRDSILFENAYSHCPLTLPSHLSMLTGLLPAEHGVRNNLGYRFDGGAHPTLARMLKTEGYATGAAVSAYVLRGATGIGASMDFFDDAAVGGPAGGGEDVSLLRRAGGESARRAMAWVESVKARPFFLLLHIYEPHFPYEPPEPFRSRYGPSYDSEIATSDGIVGAFLEQLKRDGIYERSIIFFVSDHGEGLGEHGEQEHGILLYREVLHVPLLLKLPRSRNGGTRVRDTVGLIDIAPTVATLLGLKAPEGLKGVSLLDRDARPQPRRIYSETYYPRIHLGWSDLRSLLDNRYHYIGGPKPELYEVDKDPRETADTLPTAGGVASSMKRELEAYGTGFSEPGAIDAEAAERLRALGYLSGRASEPRGETLPSPKDRIQVHEELKAAFQLARQGRNQEALTALQQVLKGDPRCFDAQRELAATLARLGRFVEAAEGYKKAMGLSPPLAPSVALSLSQVNIEMGKLGDAEANAKAALPEDPGHAHQLLAKVALLRNDLGEAERQARLGMPDATDPNGAMILAQVYLRQSQPQSALDALEKARVPTLGRKPVAGFDFLRGDVLARLHRYPEAEAAFQAEIRAFPRNARAYASQAVVLALEGRSQAEVHDLLDSMVRASPSRETILLAAKTLDFMGDAEGARAWRHRGTPPPTGRP
jgi:arylsulfatase A-like enzyme/Flp pilus assembly protein TadD